MSHDEIWKIRYTSLDVSLSTQINLFFWIVLVSGVNSNASYLYQVYTNVAQLWPPGLLMYSFIPHLHICPLQDLICEPGETGATHVPRCRSALWSGQGQSLGLSQWEDAVGNAGGGRGKGGADGVTECLGTCHFVSALASTSGLHSLSPQAKHAQLVGLDHRVRTATFTLPPYSQWHSLTTVPADHRFTSPESPNCNLIKTCLVLSYYLVWKKTQAVNSVHFFITKKKQNPHSQLF